MSAEKQVRTCVPTAPDSYAIWREVRRCSPSQGRSRPRDYFGACRADTAGGFVRFATSSQRRQQFDEVSFRTIGLPDVLQFTAKLGVLVQFSTQLPDGSHNAESLLISGVLCAVLHRDWQQAAVQRNGVVRMGLRANSRHL